MNAKLLFAMAIVLLALGVGLSPVPQDASKEKTVREVLGDSSELRDHLRRIADAPSETEFWSEFESFLNGRGLQTTLNQGGAVIVGDGAMLMYPSAGNRDQWLISWRGGEEGEYIPSHRISMPRGKFLVACSKKGVATLGDKQSLADVSYLAVGLADDRVLLLSFKTGLVRTCTDVVR